MRRRIVAFLIFLVLGLVMMTWTQSGTGGGGQSNVGGGSGTSTPTTPGGTNGQVQYNNNGAFGGASAVWSQAQGSLTITSQASNGGIYVVNGGSSRNVFQVQSNASGGGNNFVMGDTGSGTMHVNQGQSNTDFSGKLACVTSTITKTFSTAFTSTPVVIVFDETTKGGANLTAISNSAFTVSCTGATDALDYIVIGNAN